MGGPRYAAQAVAGAVVGHFWWWGVWGSQLGSRGGVLHRYATAPAWLRNLVGEGNIPPPPPGEASANSGGGIHIVPPRRTLATGKFMRTLVKVDFDATHKYYAPCLRHGPAALASSQTQPHFVLFYSMLHPRPNFTSFG
ncbi:hypothetical protein E4T56_gene10368 [Termitomyces sp. T112]|nr:hypothetical protein E4T56_gene10368 [Termitomyces sp. T112]